MPKYNNRPIYDHERNEWIMPVPAQYPEHDDYYEWEGDMPYCERSPPDTPIQEFRDANGRRGLLVKSPIGKPIVYPCDRCTFERRQRRPRARPRRFTVLRPAATETGWATHHNQDMCPHYPMGVAIYLVQPSDMH